MSFFYVPRSNEIGGCCPFGAATEMEALLNRIENDAWTKRANLIMCFQDLDKKITRQVTKTQVESVICQNVDIMLNGHVRELLFGTFQVVEPWSVGPTNRFDYKKFVLRVDRVEIE